MKIIVFCLSLLVFSPFAAVACDDDPGTSSGAGWVPDQNLVAFQSLDGRYFAVELTDEKPYELSSGLLVIREGSRVKIIATRIESIVVRGELSGISRCLFSTAYVGWDDRVQDRDTKEKLYRLAEVMHQRHRGLSPREVEQELERLEVIAQQAASSLEDEEIAELPQVFPTSVEARPIVATQIVLPKDAIFLFQQWGMEVDLTVKTLSLGDKNRDGEGREQEIDLTDGNKNVQVEFRKITADRVIVKAVEAGGKTSYHEFRNGIFQPEEVRGISF